MLDVLSYCSCDETDRVTRGEGREEKGKEGGYVCD